MFKKLKALSYILVKSATSPDYYKELIRSDVALSLKYYFTLVVIVSAIIALVQGAQLAPTLTRNFNSIIDQALTGYPEGLEIIVKNGEWTINKPEPFIVPLSTEVSTSGETKINNLLVMDHNATIEDLDVYNTLFIVNSANIISKDGDNVQGIPLKNISDLVVNKESFTDILTQTRMIANFLSYSVGLIIFAGLLIELGILKSIEILIGSVVLWGVGSFLVKGFTYKQGLKVALHAATLPLFVLLFAKTIPGLEIVEDIPFWFLVSNLCIAGVMLVGMRDGHETPKEDGTNPTLNTQN